MEAWRLDHENQKKLYGVNTHKPEKRNTYEPLDDGELKLYMFEPSSGRHASDRAKQCDIDMTNFLLYQVLKKLDRLINKVGKK